MRLDKFLKVSRIIKRRTIANEACDAQRIKVNGRAARASYEVKIGDTLEISMGGHLLRVEVLSVSEHVTKEGASELYRVLDNE